MTITAVVTAHGPDTLAADMVDQLHQQTRRPDEVLVYASCVPEATLDTLRRHPAVTRLEVVPDEQDWGHAKRDRGLSEATGTLVGFFNDDDRYDPTYLQVMEATGAGHDLVMCRWDEKGQPRRPRPRVNHVTAGNFLARTALARDVGWTSRRYAADGDFIQALVAAGARWTVADQLLYWHR